MKDNEEYRICVRAYFCQNFFTARHLARKTIADVAKGTGFPAERLKQWERGEELPALDELFRLALAVEWPPHALLLPPFEPRHLVVAPGEERPIYVVKLGHQLKTGAEYHDYAEGPGLHLDSKFTVRNWDGREVGHLVDLHR